MSANRLRRLASRVGAGAYNLATVAALLTSGLAWGDGGLYAHSDITNFDAGEADAYGTFAYGMGWFAFACLLALLAPFAYLFLRSQDWRRMTSHVATQSLLALLCVLTVGVAAVA